MQDKPLRIVPRSDDFDGIVGHLVRKRNLGENPPVRTPEVELAVRLSLQLVALLVDRAVVPATEQGEIRQRGGTALRPVTNVMPLPEPHATAREAAAAVAVMERSP